jgi:hypothetical protein
MEIARDKAEQTVRIDDLLGPQRGGMRNRVKFSGQPMKP